MGGGGPPTRFLTGAALLKSRLLKPHLLKPQHVAKVGTLCEMRPEPELSCPRCGYDQSGVIASWKDACSLEGTCSECGLGFRWGEVLNPALTVPRWSFEHARERFLNHAGRTLVRGFVPTLLWRGMRMAHPVRVGRLTVLLLALIIGVHAVLAVGSAGVAWYGWGAYAAVHPSWIQYVDPVAVVRSALLWPYGKGPFYASSFLRLGLTHPLLHLVLLWVVLAPLPFLLLGETFSRCRVRRVHLWRGWVYSLTAPATAVLLRGVDSLVMNVRSLPTLPDLYGFELLAGWIIEPFWAVPVLVAAWLGVWWALFVRDYLRLPQAMLTAMLMLLISGLAAFALLYYAPGIGLRERLYELWSPHLWW